MVHTYSLNGYHFAIDANSGSIHVLDQIAYDMLQDASEMPLLKFVKEKLKGKYPVDEISEAYAEIVVLHDGGMLFSTLESLESAVGAGAMQSGLKALCLHVAHDCNLRCEYCFAAKGDYNSGRHLMSREVALQAVDYLVANSAERRNVEIDFFGGEPLMNFDVVKEVVAYGRQLEKITNKHFYFTITTNGVLLDREKIDFINKHMDNVVLSVDGRKEIHDAVRHDAAGRGSYDRLVPLALELVGKRAGKSYFVRGTFTTRNKNFTEDVQHLADLGFEEISVEPVVGSGGGLHFQAADVPDILREYETLARQYMKWLENGRKIRFYHFNIDIYNGPCLLKRVAACGAGGEYMSVAPAGELYPCHQFVGQKRFAIGDIFKGTDNADMIEKFKANNIFAKKPCRDCWAQLFCAGGCHADAYFSNGSIASPNELSCTLQKKRIECAVMIQVWQADREKQN